jgi:hypothetical protein
LAYRTRRGKSIAQPSGVFDGPAATYIAYFVLIFRRKHDMFIKWKEVFLPKVNGWIFLVISPYLHIGFCDVEISLLSEGKVGLSWKNLRSSNFWAFSYSLNLTYFSLIDFPFQ